MLTLSLVICAYTEARWGDLQAAVESIRGQSRWLGEVIVVIDHNSALFELASRNLKGVNVIHNDQQRGLSGARNSGIAAARGDWIVFMDEDAVAEAGWLEQLCEAYQDPSVIGVGGAILPEWQGGKPAWFPEEFNWVVGCTYRGLPENTATVRNLIGCNMSLRREVFESVGGFRLGIGRIGVLPFGCEETELCIRANQRFPERRFVYEPRARVIHRVPESRRKFKYFISRCYAEGISKALVTFVIGGRDGLSSERSYTMKTLPLGILRGIRDTISGRGLSGLGRAGVILVGFTCTAIGFLVGKISLTFQRENFGTLRNEVEFP